MRLTLVRSNSTSWLSDDSMTADDDCLAACSGHRGPESEAASTPSARRQALPPDGLIDQAHEDFNAGVHEKQLAWIAEDTASARAKEEEHDFSLVSTCGPSDCPARFYRFYMYAPGRPRGVS